MKKVITLIFMLALLSLVYQFAVIYLIVVKNTEYVITADNGVNYTINESFQKVGKKDLYQFSVKNNDTNDVYVYTINKEINRQNMIIKELKSFDQDNLNCLVPVFKDDTVYEVLCKSGGEIVSYSYLKQQGNTLVDSFITTLKNDGYSSLYWESEGEYDNVDIISYMKNFPLEFGVTIWQRSKVHSIQKDYLNTTNLFTEKRSTNALAALAGSHYVTVNMDDADTTPKYDRIYLVNVKRKGTDKLYIEEGEGGISKNIYFAGVVGDKVYIVDKTNRKEYEVNTTERSIKLVGSETLTTGVYYNGEEMINVPINELTDKDYYFRTTIDVAELTEKYGNVEIKESNNKYYFKNAVGEIWYVLKKDLDHPVKLFAFSDYREWKVKGDTVFGINGDTVYMYSPNYGLKAIVKDPELLTMGNIYDVFEK